MNKIPHITKCAQNRFCSSAPLTLQTQTARTMRIYSTYFAKKKKNNKEMNLKDKKYTAKIKAAHCNRASFTNYA